LLFAEIKDMNKKEFDLKKTALQKALKACGTAFKYSLFFSFIASLLTLATSLYALQIFDRVLSSGSMDTLTALTFVVSGLVIILGLIQIVRSYISADISLFLDEKLSSLLLSDAISLSAINKSLQGSLFHRDLSSLKNFLTGPATNSIIDSPWAFIYIIVIFFIHPAISLIVIIGASILLFLAFYNEKQTAPLLKNASEFNLQSIKEIEISTRNAEVIEAMGMKSEIIKNWRKINKKALNLQIEASGKTNLIANITKTVRLFIYIFTMAAGAYLVVYNKMSPGGIIAASILSGKALAPFDAAISNWKSVLSARRSYERLNKLMRDSTVRDKAMRLPPPKGDLKIEKVVYKPELSEKPIIKGIDIKIAAGESVCIIGHSGAGKTTLAKLIAGIYKPNAGKVRLDNADIYTWDREDIKNHIGYLPQEVELFNGKLKDNIARMDKGADPQKVIKAAEDACVNQLILELPNGYETDIGVAGSALSAGQKQRIALARAFYNDPKLIILDEPNSNLDKEGETALTKAIYNAKEKKITLIIISHREMVLQAIDKIFVIHQGEAKLFGDKDKVLEQLTEGKKAV